MAKKKPTTPRTPKFWNEDMTASLEAINRVEGKLDDFIRRTDEAITALLQMKESREEDKDELAREHVIVLMPNTKKTKKDLPVLYYQGALHLPSGEVEYSWTKELDKAAVDSGRVMQLLVDEMDGVGDYPTHYHCPEITTLHEAQRDDASMVEDEDEDEE